MRLARCGPLPAQEGAGLLSLLSRVLHESGSISDAALMLPANSCARLRRWQHGSTGSISLLLGERRRRKAPYSPYSARRNLWSAGRRCMVAEALYEEDAASRLDQSRQDGQ